MTHEGPEPPSFLPRNVRHAAAGATVHPHETSAPPPTPPFSPLPSFSSVCVFLSGISLCNPVSSLLPFIRPQTVGAKAVSQRSDSSAIRHAWGLQRCLFLSNSLVLSGQPPKQFYNLAAGTKLPFTLLLARFLRQFISHLCL